MSKITRRRFIKGITLASLSGAVALAGVAPAAGAATPKATIIDLGKCDGCRGRGTPACVAACRSKNATRFPRPTRPILDYWPRKGYEDWSDKQHLTNRLTPYNWLYVQPVTVQGHELFVPRRCMHCENPPCARICPFAAYTVHSDSAVVVDPDMCFGGAKCRDVCPWGIPARQAGVGLYLKLVPQLAGGGVMFKCDMCHDLVAAGHQPACVSACPRQAMIFGDKAQLQNMARELSASGKAHVYGLKENGGTATYYLSPVPFAAIDAALGQQGAIDGKPGRPGMPPDVPGRLDSLGGWAKAMAAAPFAAVAAAGLTAYRSLKNHDNDND